MAVLLRAALAATCRRAATAPAEASVRAALLHAPGLAGLDAVEIASAGGEPQVSVTVRAVPGQDPWEIAGSVADLLREKLPGCEICVLVSEPERSGSLDVPR